jgi:cell division protein ZapA
MDEMRETNSVRATIYNQDYVLRTNGDPRNLETLCAILDDRMKNIAEATGAVDTIKVAVLAALSMADDARRAKEDMIKLDEAISKRSLACASMLDRSISEARTK